MIRHLFAGISRLGDHKWKNGVEKLGRGEQEWLITANALQLHARSSCKTYHMQCLRDAVSQGDSVSGIQDTGISHSTWIYSTWMYSH